MDADLKSLRVYTSDRGFHGVEAEKYQNERGEFVRLIQESSAIGFYPDALNKPGSSFLWVGDHVHLDREQVKELKGHLERWLETGSLK